MLPQNELVLDIDIHVTCVYCVFEWNDGIMKLEFIIMCYCCR